MVTVFAQRLGGGLGVQHQLSMVPVHRYLLWPRRRHPRESSDRRPQREGLRGPPVSFQMELSAVCQQSTRKTDYYKDNAYSQRRWSATGTSSVYS